MSNLLVLATDAVRNLEISFLAIPGVLIVLFLVLQVYDGYTSRIDVPTVGTPPGIFGRWKAPYRWMRESRSLMDEGMSKYGIYGKPFKIRMPTRWVVFFTNPDVLNEMKNMSPTIMSFRKAADEAIRTDLTFSKGLMDDAWHLKLIQKNLTEKLTRLLPEIVSEVVTAWEDNTDIGDEWTEVNPWVVMLKVSARATNRVLVGLPLCRNDEFINTVINFAEQVVHIANTLDLVPGFLQTFTVKFLMGNTRDKQLNTVFQYIAPIFEERRLRMKSENWDPKNEPNDAFTWVLESSPPGTSIHSLVLNMLFITFTAIHTTTITMVQVIFDLAANPKYQEPLRDEIEAQLGISQGWSPQALTEMKKLDSVLRESSRMNGANICTILRKVVTPYTFCDGTYVPKGAWVVAPSISIHRWDKFYPNPDVFDGFRWYEMRKIKGNASKFQNTRTSTEYLPFGDGLSVCPGRFFATNEMKIMLANLLCKYEFQFAEGVKRPENLYSGFASFPDGRVVVLFRKRKDFKDSGFFSGAA